MELVSQNETDDSQAKRKLIELADFRSELICRELGAAGTYEIKVQITKAYLEGFQLGKLTSKKL